MVSKGDKRRMELLNLTYTELEAVKLKARLDAVKNKSVVFVDSVYGDKDATA